MNGAGTSVGTDTGDAGIGAEVDSMGSHGVISVSASGCG